VNVVVYFNIFNHDRTKQYGSRSGQRRASYTVLEDPSDPGVTPGERECNVIEYRSPPTGGRGTKKSKESK